METLLPIIVGIGAAILLLTAGYLFGAQAGRATREKLRGQNVTLTEELTRLEERNSQYENGDENLRVAIQKVLTPLVQRDQLSYDLSRLEGNPGHHRDLTALLDQMAEKGNFSGVLLSDEQGLTLATSSGTQDPEQLGATSSLLLLLSDRMSRGGSAPPLSLLVHDGADLTTLCRLFQVENQRLLLTVVCADKQLGPEAFDPALAKLNRALLTNQQLRDDAPEADRSGR